MAAFDSRAEQLQKRPFSPGELKYLLSGPLMETFANVLENT